jgi:hypothetical protein
MEKFKVNVAEADRLKWTDNIKRWTEETLAVNTIKSKNVELNAVYGSQFLMRRQH